MPIDTREDRMSGIGLLLPYRTPAVEPDPGVDTAERQAGAWSYSGVAAGAPQVSGVVQIITFMGALQAPGPN